MEMFNLPRKPTQEPFKIPVRNGSPSNRSLARVLRGAESFTEFCHRVKPAFGINCLMLPWCRMLAGN
jgi:hypothetical protein